MPLDTLFRPRSVGVVGASSDPNKIGGRPLHILKRGGFVGAVWSVNTGAAEVQGVPAVASLDAVLRPLDLAVVALAAPQVTAAMRAAAKGARAAVVFSAGSGEEGEVGRALQAELLAVAKDARIRLLGPNSLGLFAAEQGLFATFAIALHAASPKPGGVAIATQSGALGSYAFAMAEARGLGFSVFAATRNEADVDVAGCIAWLARDPATRVICTAMEAARDGRRLMRAIATARAAGKAVIAMKVGATTAGAAAASHTGSLAGSDAAYDAAFRQPGAVRVRSIEAMVDAAYAASGARPIREGRVAVVTTSGGVDVLLADAAGDGGLSCRVSARRRSARSRRWCRWRAIRTRWTAPRRSSATSRDRPACWRRCWAVSASTRCLATWRMSGATRSTWAGCAGRSRRFARGIPMPQAFGAIPGTQPR